MRDFPKKNCLVAGSMAMFSALCFAGAAYFYANSPQNGLMPLYIVLAIGEAGFGAFLFKKSRKSA